VVDGDYALAARSEPMERGHQERLGSLVRETAAEAGVAFRDLAALAVTVGPGSFTGLRVGLSFAKGMGLALGKPVTGVGTLEALAATAGREGLVAAALDARREQLYLQVFRDGAALTEPEALSAEDAAARLRTLHGGEPAVIVGSGAGLLDEALPDARLVELAAPDPVVVARLARAGGPPARPLYLRAPDAKLPAA
jgi:tRNA threonylcarbamoyladenosine biosynthesis protein TsaB